MLSDKSTMNRKVLEQHGIILSEDVYSPRNSDIRVPKYVRNIVEAFLEHDIRIPDSLQTLFEKEQEQQFTKITNAEYTVLPPQSAFFSVPKDVMQPMSGDIKAIEDKFEQVAKLTRTAREYDAAKVSQEAWKHFLGSYIFRSYEDSGVQVSRHSKLFDAWTIENNISWNAVSKLNQISEGPPQPSFTYGFPVHVSDDPEKTPLTGFRRNECVTNFSLNALADLGPIVTCPTIHPSTIKTRMTEGQNPERKDLICFPWALVEVQFAAETAEACYCRAANGANAALDMQRQLQPVWVAAKDIPPVILFTCSGLEIRLWVSFLEFKAPKTSARCICIWAGTLTATWCIVVLREIIQNITFWASRVLKPQISSRISQIRHTAPAPPAYPHGPPPEQKKQKMFVFGSYSEQKLFVFGSSSNATAKTEKSHTQDNNTSQTEKPLSNVQSRFLFPGQNLRLFDAEVKTDKLHAEDTNTYRSEKPVSSIQTGLLFSEPDFKSLDAEVNAEKPHATDSKTLKSERSVSSIQRGFLSTEQKPSIINSSDVTVKVKKATYVLYHGKKILIRLPSTDERKPRRVTEADWDAKFYSWLRARPDLILDQTASVDKQNASESGEAVAKISGNLQNLQIGPIEKTERNKEVEDKIGLKKSTPDIGEGEFETKKSPVVDDETQGTHPGPSYTPKDQSLGKCNTGVDGSDEADVDSVGKYFVYRTNESFHARTYDAAIWDSDGENDQSYVTSVSGSEADSEGSDVESKEDDADDEGSESASSNDYGDASVEELLSELKFENEGVDSSSPSSRGPPGQVGNLTLDDIDDMLYTAANVISGDDFIQLKPVQTLLENLKGVDLLDATWRALENWEGQTPNLYSDQMRSLLATVGNLNDFVVSQDENTMNLFAHHHLTMALRKVDLDQTLQGMQKKGDWRLLILLKSLLRSWDGEKCMELLSSELVEMGLEEFDNMLQEAFDVVYSDSNLLNTVR